jgi:TetR/AcrR family transcriptional regulator, mexJK operon transcriptional repressor
MPQPTRRQKSSSKRDLIVAAARKLFLGAGYGATSMDAIAAEAGVSKRTVYSHFLNKEYLFAAIMGNMCDIVGGGNPDEPTASDTPEQILKQIGLHIMDNVLNPEAIDVFRVVLSESSQFPELGKTFWQAGPCVMKNYIAGYLSDLDRRGILTVADPDLSAFQFMGMIKWPHHMRLLFGAGDPPSPQEFEAGIDLAIKTFVGGLRSTS